MGNGRKFSIKKAFEYVRNNSKKSYKEVQLVKKISSAQIDEKRRKGLCYHCEEKWGPGHVCKKPKVYLIQVEDSNGEEGMSKLIAYNNLVSTQVIDTMHFGWKFHFMPFRVQLASAL